MDPFIAPAVTVPPLQPVPTRAVAPALADDEVPLGWECANPALQIERWGMQEDSCG